MRFFNTAGPVNPEWHYCVPPLERIDLQEVLMMIDQRKYFVMHAPRQTGKTTCLLALMDYLSREGRYHCVYANFEVAQGAREHVARAIKAILNEIADRAARMANDDYLRSHWPDILNRTGEDASLNQALTQWADNCDRPIVLLIDEIDTLIGDTLISVLRQLRAGYDKRPAFFPQSIILCGVRDVRDYRIHASSEKEVITGGSAFNIKSESLRVGDFVKAEMIALLDQHTHETGQVFDPEARQAIWDLSQGQPWLINALGYFSCFKNKNGRNRGQDVTGGMINQAAESLIVRRETHLDQLADKLQESRVRRVIQPLLAGQGDPRKIPMDDVQYVEDLGLITTRGQLRIANPIYREVIPRQLTYSTQLTISQESAWYIDDDGRLNVSRLLQAFQSFFRDHSESWLERFDYKEAGPQLLMQAFLQRIVNSGGRVEREYGLGAKRTDLLVIWPMLADKGERNVLQTGILPDWPLQKTVIELKVRRRESLDTIKSEGLAQTHDYMDRCGADDGHLVIFDRRPGISWEERLFSESNDFQNVRITVWGM